MNAYDEILEFVTSSPTLEQIVDFQHSPETLARVAYLQQADQDGTITLEEINELGEFERARHTITQLKVRARRRLGLD